MSNYQDVEDINNILGIDMPQDETDILPPPSPEEQRKRLRNAQNINRGHPRKGEKRQELKQVNVSCLSSLGEQFTELSLKTGKTKRTLLEEALINLIRRYSH